MATPRPHPHIADRIRTKIYESVLTSPVTIVVGPTGSGKSTLVPSALLDDTGGPVLCTQPRRLAVVAVATRVSQVRGVTLGGAEVGYHVGQANHSLSRTKLVFTTAGILLEELRAQGVSALTKYKVVVIDECHERSPESDLVLSLAKSMLRAHPNKNIRIILMSATFDHGRYRQYFSDVPGCDRIETITLETASSFETFYARVETHYLEKIILMLPDREIHQSLQRSMRLDPDSEMRGHDGGKSLSTSMLILIRSLIAHLHTMEPIQGSFVVFAPTYRHLEQIYDMLLESGKGFKLGVLHSSVDMEYCLRSMKQSTSDAKHRKILLASAIADSSVTIPGVTCIIDLCRALQVKWDPSLKAHVPKTVWASKSICDQRKGRTGRTCPGRVFRLVPMGFYISRLENWEVPQLALSSCRDEALKLLCAGSISDPSEVLERCLDPPPKNVVVDALQFLESVGACVRGRKRFVPTKSGELMATLPFQVEDSLILLKGAQHGLLHETLALRAIFSHKPAPIVHHFGENQLNEASMRRFFPQVDLKDSTSVNIANLSAFFFWDAFWNGNRSKATMMQFAHATGSRFYLYEDYEPFLNGGTNSRKACCNVWRWTPSLEEKHTEWCQKNGINPTSVRGIAELIENTWNVLYMSKFEPEWLLCTDPTPSWRRERDWKGHRSSQNDILSMVYGPAKAEYLTLALTALCEKQATVSTHAMRFLGLKSSKAAGTSPRSLACLHFLQGNCTFGVNCRHSHSPDAVRPHCRYFLSGHCSRGNGCMYSHEREDTSSVDALLGGDGKKKDPLVATAPLLLSLKLEGGTRDWFCQHRRNLLLLGDGSFEFTNSLTRLRLRPAYASCLSTDRYEIDSTSVYSVDATRIHLNADIVELVHDGLLESFAWNFPFTGIEEDDTVNESLILGTFHSLHELRPMLSRDDKKMSFAVTLQGDQFARWNVMRSAIRTGWRLSSWGTFSAADYPGYSPRRANGDTFPVSSARFYVFTKMPQ